MQSSSYGVPIVMGILDSDDRVTHITEGVTKLLGYTTSECVDISLVSMLHSDDLPLLNDAGGGPVELRMRHTNGEWRRVVVMISDLRPADGHVRAFVLAPADPTSLGGLESRVAALEGRMRRIGHEVRSVGLEDGSSFPDIDEETLAVLSPRQADIAQRMAAGQRVPTIARDMGLSQSTVRNHLSQIFRKLDVASQAELIDTVQRNAWPRRDAPSRSR